MADTITEFLVSIGYDLDVKQAKDFEKSIADLDALGKKLALAFAGAAAALVATFTKVTIALDGLNFEADRAGTSAENLRQLTYALEMQGVSSDRAGGLMASFAARLRTMPNLEGFIQQLGVRTREHGALRDHTDMLLDFVEATSKESYVLAYSQAEVLGIPEQNFRLLRRTLPEIRKRRAEQAARDHALGLDTPAAQASSTEVMRSYRRVAADADALTDLLTLRIVPTLMPVIDAIDKWLRQNQKYIVSAVGEIIDVIETLAAWFGRLLDDLAPVAASFLNMIESISGGHGLVLALEVFGATYAASVAIRAIRFNKVLGMALLALIAAFELRKAIGLAPVQADGPSYIVGARGPAERPSLFSRVADRALGYVNRGVNFVRRAVGLPTNEPAASGPVSYSGPPLDRSGFDKELENPAVRQRLFAMTEAEVGSQGARDQQAFMEETINRARARHQTLWQTMQGGYYPAITHQRAAERVGDPALDRKYQQIYDAVRAGSNISNFATGNESGSVHSGGAPVVFWGNGERGVIEIPDRGWQDRPGVLAPLPPPRQDVPPLPAPATAIPPVQSDPFKTSALVSSPDDDDGEIGVERVTKITVKGDNNSHHTANLIEKEQRRINGDFVQSATQVA